MGILVDYRRVGVGRTMSAGTRSRSERRPTAIEVDQYLSWAGARSAIWSHPTSATGHLANQVRGQGVVGFGIEVQDAAVTTGWLHDEGHDLVAPFAGE